MDAVLLGTCVLLKSYLCDTLLSIAEEGAYRPLWSEHVLAELRRNLVNAEDRVKHIISIEVVLGGQLGARGLADGQFGNPQRLGHRDFRGSSP